MNKHAKGLFDELFYVDLNKEHNEEIKDDGGGEQLEQEQNTTNILIQDSPIYPRIFWGESAKPLMNGMFPESEYVDDNIHRTYKGLISYLG